MVSSRQTRSSGGPSSASSSDCSWPMRFKSHRETKRSRLEVHSMPDCEGENAVRVISPRCAFSMKCTGRSPPLLRSKTRIFYKPKTHKGPVVVFACTADEDEERMTDEGSRTEGRPEADREKHSQSITHQRSAKHTPVHIEICIEPLSKLAKHKQATTPRYPSISLRGWLSSGKDCQLPAGYSVRRLL